MSKPFDYSKWDNIELSDDEDDVHPNIDKESWFRLKHRSRVEREEKEEADKVKIRKQVCMFSVPVASSSYSSSLVIMIVARIILFSWHSNLTYFSHHLHHYRRHFSFLRLEQFKLQTDFQKSFLSL